MFISLHILISIPAWLIFTSGEPTGQHITSQETTTVFDYEERFLGWIERHPSTPSLKTDVCDLDYSNMSMLAWRNQRLVIKKNRAKIIDDNLVSIPAGAFPMSIQVMTLIVLSKSVQFLIWHVLMEGIKLLIRMIMFIFIAYTRVMLSIMFHVHEKDKAIPISLVFHCHCHWPPLPQSPPALSNVFLWMKNIVF